MTTTRTPSWCLRFRRISCAGFVAVVIGGVCSQASAGVWIEEAKLLASQAAPEDHFGRSVAVSGSTALIGARGSAYIFNDDGSEWGQVLRLSEGDSWFGGSVGLSGTRAIVGSHGAAYVYQEQGPIWTRTVKLTSGSGGFGERVAISGSTAIISNPYEGIDQGAAYVFEDTATGWQQEDKVVPKSAIDRCAYDYFGWSVGISGSTAIVGARTQLDCGKAYVFEESGSAWPQAAKLTSDPLADWFSDGVAISGSTVLIGAPLAGDNGDNSGAAYVFERGADGWQELAKLLPSDGATGDMFGQNVAVSGSTAIISASGDDDNGDASGSAYVFADDGSGWYEVCKLLPADGEAGDRFGFSVALDGRMAVIGASHEDENGIDAGAAYIFTPEPATLALLAAGGLGLLVRRRE